MESTDGQTKKKVIQITITESCNLNCIYCYEHNKNNHFMSVDQVIRIFKEAFTATDSSEEIEFDFHGGEIALGFEIIQKSCEWLWKQKWPKKYMCFATTNGTLIHGELQKWFERNRRRFWLGLSLDGTPQMHNINRSNSFSKIDIDFFKRCWPNQAFKMTISRDTLSSLFDGIVYMHSLGIRFSANLAYGLRWNDDLLRTYHEQLLKVSNFYLAHPDLEVVNLLNLPLWLIGQKALFPSQKDIKKKWCGTGCHMVCYSPDGIKYPCQGFLPSTGSLHGESLFSKIDFNDNELFTDPMCQHCVFEPACPVCYAQNYANSGSLSKRATDLCKYRKIEALAASFLQGKMLVEADKYSLTKRMPKRRIVFMAKGVQEVQSKLIHPLDDTV